jgi:hypothetical protein
LKKACIVFINLMILAGLLGADAAPVDIIPVDRVIKISNCSKLPELMVLAYETGSDIHDEKYRPYEIKDNLPLEKVSIYNTLWVVALRRSYVEQEGLNNINIGDLINTGALSATPISQPYNDYRDEGSVQAYHEEITYRISRVIMCPGGDPTAKVFLEVEKKSADYKNGKSLTKELTGNKQILVSCMSVKATEIFSSGYLDSDVFADRYHPAQVFDGDPETGWSENAAGAGIGSWVEVRLEQPVTIDKLTVMPGWFQSQYFRRNNRIKSMQILLDDFSLTAEFKDTMQGQDVVLKTPRTFTRARFIIKDVYQTADWNDTPLAEVRFFLNGEYIIIDTTGIKLIVSEDDRYR